jgi:hypothetical protein
MLRSRHSAVQGTIGSRMRTQDHQERTEGYRSPTAAPLGISCSMTPHSVLWTSLSVHPIVYPSGLGRRQPIEVFASITALHALDHGFDLRLRGHLSMLPGRRPFARRPISCSKPSLIDKACMDLRDPSLGLTQCLDTGMNGMGTRYEVILMRDSRAQYEFYVRLGFEFQRGTRRPEGHHLTLLHLVRNANRALPTAVHRTVCRLAADSSSALQVSNARRGSSSATGS